MDRNSSLRTDRRHSVWSVIGLYAFIIFSALTLLANRINPATFWPASFLSVITLPIYLINILLFFFLLFRRSVHAGAVLLVIIIGFSLLGKTYRWSDSPNERGRTDFRVLSYNLSFFSVPRVFSEAYRDPTYNMTVDNAINWLRSGEADIYCLQEFFDDEDSDIYNTVATLTRDSTYDAHFVYKDQVKNKTRRGLIILSRLPIVERGEVFISDNHFNGAIYADVRVGSDTVRIINAHLESMQLSARQRSWLRVVQAYHRGAVAHSHQANQLADFIRQSPYPTVLSGDLNELPYGYVYRQFGSLMNSAFEAAGRGFGFTYQGDKLSFLRIDHQFFTDDLEVVRYVTHTEVPFSKHLPIEAAYALP